MQPFNLMSPEAICGTVGERVRRLRLQHNLTQQQLADMTLGSLSSIRRLEARGQAPLLLLVRVSQALQVVDQWDSVFNEPVLTIAQAEKAEQLATRQRARIPKRP